MIRKEFEILSAEFDYILSPDSQVVKLADGLQFTEGPVWVDAGDYLLFSDIPADQIKRWSPHDGLSTMRMPSWGANGNALDHHGRLVTCEHGKRRVSLTELDGTVVTLADTYQGARLNSPNDLVVKMDGSIWFTDPPYGIVPEQVEQTANYVFRLDPATQVLTPAVEDCIRPNGLCFSPEEKRLYVADSSAERHHIRVFDVSRDGVLEDAGIFAIIEPGIPDGMRVDTQGRLYATAGDGIHIFSPYGELLGKIRLPETPANCAFGGSGRHTLYITARTSLYAVTLAVSGA